MVKVIKGTIVFIFLFNMTAMAQKKQMTYLALGDSYTIGESVPAEQNFPNQLAQMFRDKGVNMVTPDIVAKTGWTTAELKEGIAAARLRESYDYVTLLIGVNNQYRGLAPEDYAREFEQLLKLAIQFGGGKTSNVIVVSIPDWGATPFAKDRDRAKITEQITDFNLRNSRISAKYNVKYVDITEGSREALINPELVTGDKLHPSGVEYNRWAKAILKEIGL
jgi:lysophospholipase L1-like esterase